MADVKRVIVILLIITLVLSAISVVFNLMIYNIKSDDSLSIKRPSSNAGNIGLSVEGNSDASGGNSGG